MYFPIQPVNEEKLEYYSFSTIVERDNEQLNELVTKLRKTPYPAFIMDELWFAHALNAALIRLFNMQPHLHDPLYWHVVTTKFNPDSTVRKAHKEVDENGEIKGYGQKYFPYIIRRFFESIVSYFFTKQAKSLRVLLCKLSPPEEFQNWWDQIITMSSFPQEETLTRTIYYKDKHNHERKINLENVVRDRTDVEIVNGPTLKYTLVYWIPEGPEDKKALEEITEATRDQPIAFAYEYGIPDYNEKDWSELSL